MAPRRKRRLYASQDVRELVLQEAAAAAAAAGAGSGVRDAILGQRQQLGGGSGAAAAAPFFPLEVFDDAAFETRPPRGWVPADPGASSCSTACLAASLYMT